MNAKTEFKGAYLVERIMYFTALIGAIFFAVGLVSFSSYPVRTVMTGSPINLTALYMKLALGVLGCSAVCAITHFAGRKLNK